MANPAQEVLIVGGGPAGLATAIHLRNRNVAVCVIERSDYDQPRVGEHLPPEALGCLAELAPDPDPAWLEGHRVATGVRSFWGSGTPADNHYFFSLAGHGRNLSRPAFDRQVADWAERRGVRLYRKAKLIGFNRAGAGPGTWAVRIQCGGRIFSKRVSFLVDASGRGAVLARRLGAVSRRFDRLVGVVALVKPATYPVQHGQDVLIEACADGWWYVAPLACGNLIATWMTDSDQLQGAAVTPLSLWLERMRQAQNCRSRLVGFVPPERVTVRAAASCRLERVGGDGWLATGDAAAAFDPLSSQGIFKGLRCAGFAAEAIAATLAGDESALENHQQRLDREFAAYLEMRTAYYNLEGRWPSSPFWQRRQSHPGDGIITLDPHLTLVAAKGGPSRRTAAHETWRDTPLLGLAGEPIAAHQLANRYRHKVASTTTDRQIILAIQHLLYRGLLVPHKEPLPSPHPSVDHFKKGVMS